jgi:hypothetical protein
MNRIVRQALLALTLATFVFALAAPASAAEPARMDLDLPAQSLDAALEQLATASGHTIVAPQELTEGKTTPPVSGLLTLDEALARKIHEGE